MAVKYLDNAGTQYLVNKIKAIDGKIPTESQITTMITTALNTYKEGIVTIVESLPQTGEEGKLYLLVDPSDSDVYIVYTWEENAFKRMGSKTFTLTVDSALSDSSTNPVQNKVIKSALDGKANSSHTHGSITNDGKLGTASRVVITGTDKKIGISTVTTTELGYLSGVTSAIQTQLNSKSATGHTHTAGDVAGLATVATSGDYDDLSNKPSIPTNTSDLNNDSGFVTLNDFDIPSKTSDLTNDSGFITSSDVPTSTSDLINDSNFVDTSNPAVASGITSAKVTSYDSHIADTDIHVTTADKTKWNNGVSQAYVFRYSSTALVASSTNSNTLLDNTDNLKVGDKVIDSSGVLFSITAIDTANSTFTIGSALIDLAKDSDVVHKSGNEYINGDKTFGHGTLIVDNGIGSNVHGEIKLNGSRSGYIVADNASDGVFNNAGCGVSILLQDAGKPLHIGGYKVDSNGRVFVDNTNKNPVLSITSGLVQTSTLIPENDTGNSAFRILSQINYANGDTSKVLDVRFVQYDDANASSAIYSNDDGKTSLGATSRRWSKIYGTEYYYGSNNVEFSTKFVTTDTAQTISGNKTFSSINGVEPSSLSLPSGNVSDIIDISSYFSNTGSGNTNTYTAPANGWIYLRLGDISSCQATVHDADNNRKWGQSSTGSVEQLTIPILKGQMLTTQWNTSSTVNVATARFIPCQGNI